MRLDTSMHQRMSQHQILAPRMIQSMEILQLPIMDLEPDQAEILRFLISYLDDNGFLRASLLDITNDYPHPIKAGQLEEALRVIQTLDPPGVGAHDVKECLLLQLTPETPHADIV